MRRLRCLLVAAVVTAAAGAATAGFAADGGEPNPWLREPTFTAVGGPGSLHISEATPGDPVTIARWYLDPQGRIGLDPGDRATVGPKGTVDIHDLESGVWLVATESTVDWSVEVAPAPVLDVMSFNVRYDNPADVPNWRDRLGPILAMIDDRRPDVIGTQEALAHQVDDLATGLPDYSWIGVGRDDGVAAGEYAAIFYRHDVLELVDSGTFWLSETPEVPSRGWDAALPRIVTWAELRRVGQKNTFFVFNTHFDHEGAVARAESAALLAERVGSLAAGRPAFVTGDLNLLWIDPALEPLRAILSDTRETAETTDAIGSFNAFLVPGGLWSIDFVLHDHGRVVRFETVDDDYGVSYISDHYPVVATIECGACG